MTSGDETRNAPTDRLDSGNAHLRDCLEREPLFRSLPGLADGLARKRLASLVAIRPRTGAGPVGPPATRAPERSERFSKAYEFGGTLPVLLDRRKQVCAGI